MARPTIEEITGIGRRPSMEEITGIGTDEPNVFPSAPRVDAPVFIDPQSFPEEGVEATVSSLGTKGKKVRPYTEEFVDAETRGLLRMGSAGSNLLRAFWEYEPPQMPTWPYVPRTKAMKQTDIEQAAKWEKRAEHLWELSKDPEIQAQNTDVLSGILNPAGETLPYIVGTTGAAIVGGPAAAFAVGASVEGNSSYQTTLDFADKLESEGKSEEAKLLRAKAGKIALAVGMFSGGVEVVGGGIADDIIMKATSKLRNKILRGGVTFTVRSLTEGLEEASQELAAITGESRYRDIEWGEVYERTKQAGKGGVALGGVFGLGRAGARGMFEPSAGEGLVSPAEQAVMDKYKSKVQERIERGGPTAKQDVESIVAQGKAELAQATEASREPATLEKTQQDLEDVTTKIVEQEQQAEMWQEPDQPLEVLKERIAEGREKPKPKTVFGPSMVQDEAETPPEPAAGVFAEEISPAEPVAAKPGDTVSPNLYIGNVTGRMKKVFGELFGKSPQDVKPFLEGAFPTKRAKIEITREQAKVAADELEADIVNQFNKNQIRTENDLALANAQWGNVRELREAIGEEPGVRPFKVIRAEGQDMRIIKNTKARIWAAVKPSTLFDSGMTVQQVLQATMKKAEVASAKGWLEGAKHTVRTHKDLGRYAHEKLRGTEITETERKRLINIVTSKRTDIEKAHAIAAIDMLSWRTETRGEIREFRKTVGDIKRKYRAGEVELGMLPDKVRNEVLNIMKTFDPQKISEKKEAQLQAREHYIQRTAGTVAEAFESLEENVEDILRMPNARIKELQRLKQVPLRDLDVDDIAYINQSLKDIIARNDKKWLINSRMRATKLRDKIRGSLNKPGAIKEIKTRGVFQETKELFPKAKKFIATSQSSLRTLLGSATGKDNKATMSFYDNLVQANRNKAALKKQFIISARRKVNDIGFTASDWRGLQKKIEVTINGKSRKIAIDELLPLYMHTKAEGNLRRILKTVGLNFSKYAGQKISRAELNKITEQIPDKYKQFGDAYFELARERAKELNKTSLRRENREIARSKAYYPVVRQREEIIGGKPEDISTSIEQRGRYLPRTGGTGEIKIIPFSKEFMNSIEIDASYATMTEAMQDARTLFGNSGWQKKMRHSNRKRELDAIITMAKRIQGIRSSPSFLDQEANALLSRVGKSILSARPSGMGVQIASVPAAYETIEPRYFAGIKQPTPSYIKKLAEQEPLLWMRWNAKQYNFVTGAAGQKNAFKALVLGKSPQLDKLLAPYTLGDQIAIGKIHIAATRKAKAEGLKGESLGKRAMNLTIKALDSQPQWDILHRTVLTSDPSAGWRGSLMFMSARNAQYNVLLRARDDFKKGRISRFEKNKRYAGVVNANIRVSLARRLFKMTAKGTAIIGLAAAGIQDEPEEKLRQEALREFGKIPEESALNLVGLGALGPIAANIAKESLNTKRYGSREIKPNEIRSGNIFADMLLLDPLGFSLELARMVDNLETGAVFQSGPSVGEKKWKRNAWKATDILSESAFTLLGLPYSGPKSDIYYPVTTAAKPPKGKDKGLFDDPFKDEKDPFKTEGIFKNPFDAEEDIF